MPKLAQIVAVVKGVKNDTNRAFTDIYHSVLKSALLTGIQRTYAPKDDEGDKLPPEYTKVQKTAESAMVDAQAVLVRLMDTVAQQESANTNARADVVIDGKSILKDVPVTTLMFLEKQLTDMNTFVSKLPTLDPSEDWHKDANFGCYASSPKSTTKTQKVPKAFVKAAATDKHPAQVEMFTEDIVVGTWTTVKLSGAIPADRQATLIARISLLQEAVKFARETANQTDAPPVQIGQKVFDYVYAP